jgi:hypothetical protein
VDPGNVVWNYSEAVSAQRKSNNRGLLLFVDNTSALLPELLPFICQSDAFFEHAVSTLAGSLSPRTNNISMD